MIYFEWKLVYDQLKRHGYNGPLLELGGAIRPRLQDYSGQHCGTPASLQTQTGDLWQDLDANYAASHHAEWYAWEHEGEYGTIISVSVLEHVANPFTFFEAIDKLLAPSGLAIISTVWKWPYHGGEAGTDYWRFTKYGLAVLAVSTTLDVLEAGYGDIGVKGREPVYIVLGRLPMFRLAHFSRPELHIMEEL